MSGYALFERETAVRCQLPDTGWWVSATLIPADIVGTAGTQTGRAASVRRRRGRASLPRGDALGSTTADVLQTGEIGSRPGDIRHWNASFFPVRQAHEVIGLCVVVADVTAEHRLSVALAASEESHRRLAEDLQRSLLPRDLPRLAGMELGSVYRPSGVVASVGGDFYDLVELDDASCLLVIGDVEGTGPVAASLTAAVRYAIRATAVRNTDPAELLRIANEGLLREGAPNGTCTVACVLARRVGERIELHAASQGTSGRRPGCSRPEGRSRRMTSALTMPTKVDEMIRQTDS
jgi:hypothetical protein